MVDNLPNIRAKMMFRSVHKGGRFIDCLVCKSAGRTEPMLCCGTDTLISYRGKGATAFKVELPLLRIICPACAFETSMVYTEGTVPLEPTLAALEAVFAKRPAWLVPTIQQQIDGIPKHLPVPSSDKGTLADIFVRMGIMRGDPLPSDDPFADVTDEPVTGEPITDTSFEAWWVD